MSEGTRPIALDVSGGDREPQVRLDGAVAAAREGVPVTLVGPVQILDAVAREHSGLPLTFEPASEVVGMDESPVAAIRRKKDSSIRVAAGLVRRGQAAALVSAGNTGAALAAAKLFIGTVPGVDRPALASVVPNRAGGRTVLLDVGANIQVSTSQLREFAVMGHACSEVLLGLPEPRVALLSIGEEQGKGTDLIKEAFDVLRGAGLNFVGNCEGRDVFGGEVDVVVTDGFVGNVILKVSESFGEMIFDQVAEEVAAVFPGPSSELTAALGRVRSRFDYEEYGAAPFLGLDGGCFVCHGRSGPRAIETAIKLAWGFEQAGISAKVADRILDLHNREKAWAASAETSLAAD